jgi:hypothetical protein
MSRPKHTIESLLKEVERLRNRNDWLSEKLAEAEKLLGRKAPVICLYRQGHPLRIFNTPSGPVVLADDLIALVPDAPPPQMRNGKTYSVAVQRLRMMGLGDREAVGVLRTELSEPLGITDRGLSESLGISTKAHWIGVVTPLGIETLSGRAPDLCAWLLSELPKAVKQLPSC